MTLPTLYNPDQLPATFDDTDLFAGGSRFLDRLELFSKQAPVIEGKIGAGRYGVKVDDKVTDLGDTVDVVVITYRPQAFDYRNEQFERINDKSHPSWAEITASKVANTEWGSSWLLYERTLGFCELFLKNSARPVGKDLAGYLPANNGGVAQAATLGARLKEANIKDKQSGEKQRVIWHIPTVDPCGRPFSNMPAAQDFLDQIAKFSVTPTEVAAPAGSDR
jgi:hypothetical protein